jgi:hypothetical protein
MAQFNPSTQYIEGVIDAELSEESREELIKRLRKFERLLLTQAPEGLNRNRSLLWCIYVKRKLKLASQERPMYREIFRQAHQRVEESERAGRLETDLLV